MHEAPVRLPPELTDLIIDSIPELWNPRVNQARLQRLPIFSTLALVCHSFRNRANEHRFAHVTLHISGDSVAYNSRLSVLDRLIFQGIWPRDLAITHHVRGVHLFFDLEAVYFNRRLRTWLADGTVVKILRRILSRKAKNIATTAGHALSLIAFDPFHVTWKDLPASFAAAIEKVCRSSKITSLGLIGFRGLPRTIVSSSKIKKLIWSNSKFDLASPDLVDHDARQSDQLSNVEAQTSLSKLFANLETLDVEESTLTCLIAKSAAQRSVTICTPFLKVFKVEIYCALTHRAVSAGLIKQATSMKTLQIRINGSRHIPLQTMVERAASIFDACSSSSHLTTLSIHYSLLSRLQCSVGAHVADLLKVAMVRVQPLNLDIVMCFSAEEGSMSVADVLQGHGCIELMDLFEKREFSPQLRSFRILFVVRGAESPFHEMGEDQAAQERHKFQKKAERYLRSYFADLAELRPQIDTDISMDDERGICDSKQEEYMFI